MTSTILDCSSLDTALKSLGDLLVMSADDLCLRLSQIDLKWEGSGMVPEDRLYARSDMRTKAIYRLRLASAGFTRRGLPKARRLRKGFLPTLAALPKLWESLEVVASQWSSPAEWEEYRRSFNRPDRRFSQQFRRKVIAPGWEGPFAFLVRDAAIGRSGDHKDFTQICETLEDILRRL